MTKLNQVYKCELCGNMVEVIHAGDGELVCCGQAMKLQEENTMDAATEKHVPVIERLDTGVKIAVGNVAHPMEEKHYIEWIELLVDGQVLRRVLRPGDDPLAVFESVAAESVSARAYCNLHGLWKS